VHTGTNVSKSDESTKEISSMFNQYNKSTANVVSYLSPILFLKTEFMFVLPVIKKGQKTLVF
jgi:delta-aminolevulinic acid dehydratase/porphobilinogen synthase